MCGIIGVLSQTNNITPVLLDGLKRLEYRGYDSAGVAILNPTNFEIQRVRTMGKVQQLDDALAITPLGGHLGIGHTRWATHGIPNETNAHPHISSNDIALVHNGIIENYEVLRQQLTAKGYAFSSDTDSEVAVHIIHEHFQQSGSALQAVASAVKELTGAFALGVFHRQASESLIAVRRGSPLVIGIGHNEFYIASDVIALLPVTQQFIYLEDGDIAELTQAGVTIYDENLNLVQRQQHTLNMQQTTHDRGTFRHFMLKEIYEQPSVVQDTLEGRITDNRVLPQCFGLNADKLFQQVECIHLVACGTSYHAAMVARYWLEDIAGIPTHVEIASEYRYRHVVIPKNTLFITISQSGETADTLAALYKAKKLDYLNYLAICNVPESTLVREAAFVFMTRAGTEIGVASTKAFTTQLTSLLLLTFAIAQEKKSPKLTRELVSTLNTLPSTIAACIALNDDIKELAKRFADKHHALFLGRGFNYPIALEGALKLKEISYIHAEAYPAGELKHGPLALVDRDMPVIAVAQNDKLLEKLKSNLQEVQARGGELYIFSDINAKIENNDQVHCLTMPTVPLILAPIAYTIPLQLLAYHVAVIKGTDIDQPRNLAKSVTVE